jgi:NAD(P)-dependent dehydrogenase (short-subunit alcohol dehydrogenase family)
MSGRGAEPAEPTEARYPGIEGKVAIVTGAGSQASGIGNGRAAAVLLAQSGARVALVDAVEENIAETTELIEERGGQCFALTGDVSDPEACAAIVEAVVDRYGTVGVLVNNVGIIGPPGTVVDLDLEGWERCLRVNVNSMMLMSRFAIPHMREAGGGAIVNMSSVAGLVGGLPMLAYATSKGAVNSLTKTMAFQHGHEGIRVNAVAPGFVYTPMVRALSDEDREKRRLAAPLKTEGTGWDVGRAVVYLASDEARWITGVILTVDGGLVADGVGMASQVGLYKAPAR